MKRSFGIVSLDEALGRMRQGLILREVTNRPGAGPHRFEFVGKEPISLEIALALALANMAVGWIFGSIPSRFLAIAPRIAACYLKDGWLIELVLFIAVAAIFVIYRENVRCIDRRHLYPK